MILMIKLNQLKKNEIFIDLFKKIIFFTKRSSELFFPDIFINIFNITKNNFET